MGRVRHRHETGLSANFYTILRRVGVKDFRFVYIVLYCLTLHSPMPCLVLLRTYLLAPGTYAPHFCLKYRHYNALVPPPTDSSTVVVNLPSFLGQMRSKSLPS